MAYKNFTTETMIELSTRWADPKQRRKVLDAAARVRAYLPDLDAALAGLLANQKKGPSAAVIAALAEIMKELAEVDVLHDRKARGLHYLLTGLAELADDSDDAAAYLTLRDRLFPTGLAIVQKSYLDEAGNVKAAQERLDDSARKLADKIPLPGREKASDAIAAWLAAGTRLGELEAQRAEKEHAQKTDPTAVTAATVVQARNQWVRVIRAMVGAAELEDDADGALAQHFLEPLRVAEAAADRRVSRRADSNAKPPAEGEGEGEGDSKPVK